MDKVLAIDVSADQGVIDWAKVATQGVKAAYIQATDGETINPDLVRNVRGALAAGLEVGAYAFVYDDIPAVSAAKMFLRAIGKVGGAKRFKLPPALDYEQTTLPVAAMKEWANEWFRTVMTGANWPAKHGALYSDPGFWNPRMIELPGVLMWVADITEGEPEPLYGVTSPWMMWQFSWNRQVDGIDGPVDADWLATPDPTPVPPPAPAPVRHEPAPPDRTWVVKAGDNPYTIARALVGEDVTPAQVMLADAQILAANPNVNPDDLKVGQRLTIPDNLK